MEMFDTSFFSNGRQPSKYLNYFQGKTDISVQKVDYDCNFDLLHLECVQSAYLAFACIYKKKKNVKLCDDLD